MSDKKNDSNSGIGDRTDAFSSGGDASVDYSPMNYKKTFLNIDNSLGFESGINSSVTAGTTVNNEGIETSVSESIGMKFDGAELKLNQKYQKSVKIGDEKISGEITNDINNTISTDGSIKSTISTEANLKTENIELGSKAEVSGSTSDDSEEQSAKLEASSGVKVADGVKMTNSVSVEYAEKVQESEESLVMEDEAKVAFKNRMEVEPEKATIGKTITAAIYNTTMEAVENVMSDALTVSSKTEIEKGEEEAEETDSEEEAVKEKNIQTLADKEKTEQKEESTMYRPEGEEEREETMSQEFQEGIEYDSGYESLARMQADLEELKDIHKEVDKIAEKYQVDEEMSYEEWRQMGIELDAVEDRLAHRGESREQDNKESEIRQEETQVAEELQESEEIAEDYNYYYGMGY